MLRNAPGFTAFLILMISHWRVCAIFSRATPKNYHNYSFCLGEKLNNTYCKPQPIVIATDPGTFQYYPYYITIHECQGSIRNIAPTHQRCIPTKTREVHVDVIVMNEWDKSNGYQHKQLRVTNHTECGRGCVIKPSSCGAWQRFDDNKCECTCPYSYAPTACGKLRR